MIDLNNEKVIHGISKNRDIITVVDIGTTKIVALVGKMDAAGKIHILGMGQEDTPYNTVKRGVVLNIIRTSEMISKAIKKAENQSGIKFSSVFVGIAGQHINFRRETNKRIFKGEPKIIDATTLNDLRNELNDLQLEPGHEIISIIPQRYKINDGYEVNSPVGMVAKEVTGYYNVIEGESESINNIEKCFEKLNIKIIDLFLEPLASSEAVLTDEEREAGVALIDIGGGTTDLAVYHDNMLKYTSVISLGGNIVTSDIVKEAKLLRKHAELLKVKYGSAIAGSQKKSANIAIPGINGRKPSKISQYLIAGIIQARMQEILEIVNFELKKSEVQDKLGAGIVLTGGGAMLKDLKVLASYVFKQDVKIASPGQFLLPNENEINKPMYSTVIGLLMLGFENLSKLKAIEEIVQTKDEEAIIDETMKIQEESMKKGNTKFWDRLTTNILDFFVEKDTKLNN